MPAIRVRHRIKATRADVWEALADIASHTRWMADAERITFTTAQHEGVGTAFDCLTRVGPLSTVDRMEVTEWAPRDAMAVRHTGFFTGQGRFSLHPAARGRTLVVWRERLDFPWWLGGPLGAAAATLVLWPIWKSNLWRLAAVVEGRRPAQPPSASRTDAATADASTAEGSLPSTTISGPGASGGS